MLFLIRRRRGLIIHWKGGPMVLILGWGRRLLLDRVGYLPYRLVGGGPHLADDLDRHPDYFRHALGTEND